MKQQRAVVYGVGLASAALLVVGVLLMLSALYAYQTEEFLKDWSKKAAPPEEQAWLIAELAAKRAIRFYPVKNAELYNQLGRVFEWKHFHLPAGALEAKALRQRALQAYRTATTLRPTWPYTWTDLALIKVRLNEVDIEMSRALQQAFDMGPWRRANLHRVAEVGLIAWPSLDAAGRSVTMEAIKRGLTLDLRSAKTMWQIVQGKNGQNTVCERLAGQVPWLEQHCD